MIKRDLEKKLLNLAKWFPVVSVTGPRQSGKSTLVKKAFQDYNYVNLEEPATRQHALIDPTGFVSMLSKQTIIDEAQYAPELFSAIQARVDKENDTGQFVLLGSQNFLLLSSIKQSLAGRVGIAKLLPLSFNELSAAEILPNNISEFCLQGGYPRLFANNIPKDIFYENYLDTYITRDVIECLDVRNESVFRNFIKMCASRTGRILNISDLARDLGITFSTAQNWLSILESSYIVALLHPYSKNLGKRLIKSPKLYFYDTGLLCHLLNVRSAKQLCSHQLYGSIFENFVIAERYKFHLNCLSVPNVMYYRDDSKIEVDMIDETDANEILVAEIKSGQTYRKQFSLHARKIAKLIGKNASSMVIYGGKGVFNDDGVKIYGVHEFLKESYTKANT